MFYLLEDNRIIDSKKIKVFEHCEKTYENTGFKWLHRDNKNKYCIGKIKNQSENVFDLIEKGDLVENFSTISQVFMIINNTVLTPLDIPFDVSLIIKIYKPDNKGNYIKVWERKEE